MNPSRNTILRYAHSFSKGLYYLCIILFIAFFLILFTGYYSSGILPNIELKQTFEPGYGVGGLQLHFDQKDVPVNALLLKDLNKGMFFWLLIRGSFFVILTILIVRKIIAILDSVREVKTFYEQNIRYFREIGWWALIGFIMSCFNFSYLDNQFTLLFDIAWGPLAFGIGCYVLAEVFKEGKELLEDKNAII